MYIKNQGKVNYWNQSIIGNFIHIVDIDFPNFSRNDANFPNSKGPGPIPKKGCESPEMTLDKSIVLRIGRLTECPLCRESHPLCRLKNPTVISIWLLVGFHPATRSVQNTPADNTRKRVWQYIEKEKKER